MFTRRVIITNNPMVYKKYSGKVDIVYMENLAPYDVYSEAKKQVENGARLIKPYIKNPTSYYSTVCLFFGGRKCSMQRQPPGNRRSHKAHIQVKPLLQRTGHDASAYDKRPACRLQGF